MTLRFRCARCSCGNRCAHLERVEIVIDPEMVSCSACGSADRVKIGEDVSERLDVIPARFRVITTRRPRYACVACRDGVDQAPAPPHLIEVGIPAEWLLAQIAIAKYADGLPLYRQEAIYARDEIELPRNLMTGWMDRIGFHLEPLADRVLHHIRSGRAHLRRRDDAADLGAGRRQREDRVALDLRARRPLLRRHRRADGGVPVRR